MGPSFVIFFRSVGREAGLGAAVGFGAGVAAGTEGFGGSGFETTDGGRVRSSGCVACFDDEAGAAGAFGAGTDRGVAAGAGAGGVTGFTAGVGAEVGAGGAGGAMRLGSGMGAEVAGWPAVGGGVTTQGADTEDSGAGV